MIEFKSINKLTDSFSRLPGIGHKTAEKMAYQVLELSDEAVKDFSDALKEVKQNIRHCSVCGAYTEHDLCDVCNNELRDKSKILVVSYAREVIAFEKMSVYKGLYHVLGGVLSSVSGITPDDLNIESLLKRAESKEVQEVIVATNPNVEGETTALYIAKLLESSGVKVTRIAYGLPSGGHVEYADSLTLMKALEGRNKI